MTNANYLVDFLIKKGVTAAFGIPGGVILDFLYAMESRKEEITPYLCYHEQGAAFAACGYAQAKGELGVAYATRGPGITNMVTAIADAYYDSIPVLFVTAHAQPTKETAMRIEMDQELNPIPMLESITKYAVRVENSEDVSQILSYAYQQAMTGRKGPVVLDFLSSIFKEEVIEQNYILPETKTPDMEKAVECIMTHLANAQRPVFLIGGGVRQAKCVELVKSIAKHTQIPVLSSRLGQDILPRSSCYFGFIGSHGVRYSNFILSKADLIITLGNRMSYPVHSSSFESITEKAVTIRIDVDSSEFSREIPNALEFDVDLQHILPVLLQRLSPPQTGKWLSACKLIKDTLLYEDHKYPVNQVTPYFAQLNSEHIVTVDVGNHEFWVSYAYEYAGADQRILYSHSFGALGCALAKAIGAYYATGQSVVCFIGDQGLQMNIQELQFISANQLPITIILLNNNSSGMIRSGEKRRFGGHFVHTTVDSGYSQPDMQAISEAYNLQYYSFSEMESAVAKQGFKQRVLPCLIDVQIDEDAELFPTLPQGRRCYDMEPPIEESLYKKLEQL